MIKIRQLGFTLIEAISLIVVLGIIAAIAIPRYIDLTTSSNQNSTNSVAAALTAASAENFAKRSANSSLGSAVANCTDIGPLLPQGLPTGYTITSAAIAAGSQVNCTVTGPAGNTAAFVGLGIS